MRRGRGQGGFGKVILVRRAGGDGSLFAMKVMEKKQLRQNGKVSQSLNELKVSKMRHPFICGLHYAFQDQTRLFLVVDFMAGGEVGARLACHRLACHRLACCLPPPCLPPPRLQPPCRRSTML